jgi:hypothetical protein
MRLKNVTTYQGDEVRILATAEGWAMVRKKGAMPFVVRSSELDNSVICANCGKTKREHTGIFCKGKPTTYEPVKA